MGIKGLLPFLKKASVPVKLSNFSGYVAAVDVYCWIHKSSYACALDLALGNPTDQYVRYTLKYLSLLKSCNVKPILVFDGADLPSKAETDLKRKESKELNRKKAAEFLVQGNRAAAVECFERSVTVTPQMAHDVLRAARDLGVDCIVAPYEADAQLAYLNRAGFADFVVTEDSDLLLFGCRQVIFKLDLSGSGIFVAVTAGIGELCCGIPASQFTESKFRYMGIMAGCDYFSGIPGIGLSTAAKILRQTRITQFRELLSKLGLYVNLSSAALEEIQSDNTNSVTTTTHTNHHGDECTNRPSRPSSRVNIKRIKTTSDIGKSRKLKDSLINAAVRAERTFRLQVVFDPACCCQKRLTEPTVEDIEDEFRTMNNPCDSGEQNQVDLFVYAGSVLLDHEKAFNLALGNIDCLSHTVVDNFIPSIDKVQGGIIYSDCHLRILKTRLCSFCRQMTLQHQKFMKNEAQMSIDGPKCSNVFPSIGSVGKVNSKKKQTVLSQLNVNGANKLSLSPQKSIINRVKRSIWDKDYPLQKIWLRYTNNGTIEPALNFSCLDNENLVPTTQVGLDTISPRISLPTQGRRLLVSCAIQQGLSRFSHKRSPPKSNFLALSKRMCLAQDENSPDSQLGVLESYSRNKETSFTPPGLKPRSDLSSCILSASSYFSSTFQSKNDFQVSEESDVADALNSALFQPSGNNVQSAQPVQNSPIFHKKSDLHSSFNFIPTKYKSQLKFSSAEVAGQSKCSSSNTYISCDLGKHSDVSSTLESENSEEICHTSNRSSSSPTIILRSDDWNDSSSADCSPSFLSSHKSNQSNVDSLNLLSVNKNSGPIMNVCKSPIFKSKAPLIQPVKNINERRKNNPSARVSKMVTKAPSTMQLNIRSYFQKWNFEKA